MTKRIIVERNNNCSLLRSRTITTADWTPDYTSLLLFLSTLQSVVDNLGRKASTKDAVVKDWAGKQALMGKAAPELAEQVLALIWKRLRLRGGDTVSQAHYELHALSATDQEPRGKTKQGCKTFAFAVFRHMAKRRDATSSWRMTFALLTLVTTHEWWDSFSLPSSSCATWS